MPSPLRIALKALLLFLIFNAAYYAAQPLRLLNRLTVYNWLVPGRERLAFSEFPGESYSLSVTSVDQLVASHAIARPKAADEYRVAMLGDSGVWGYLLGPDETQAACLNKMGLVVPSGPHAGKRVRVYNLGHPTLTVMKDLLILRRALGYEPDMVLWPVTLASLYPQDQLDFPVVRAQYDEVIALAQAYNLNLPQLSAGLFPAPTWFDRTFLGQRRQIADWLRYQMFGLGWAGTRIDHAIPRFVPPNDTFLLPNEDLLTPNPMLVRLTQERRFMPADLSLDVMKLGVDAAEARNASVLIVNEPMWRSDSNPQRYNRYYPRWAYDSYREAMREYTAREGWQYVDLWDAMPPHTFTDTDFHLTASATCEYAAKLAEYVIRAASGGTPAR